MYRLCRSYAGIIFLTPRHPQFVSVINLFGVILLIYRETSKNELNFLFSPRLIFSGKKAKYRLDDSYPGIMPFTPCAPEFTSDGKSFL